MTHILWVIGPDCYKVIYFEDGMHRDVREGIFCWTLANGRTAVCFPSDVKMVNAVFERGGPDGEGRDK